jgi:hypothetical protein
MANIPPSYYHASAAIPTANHGDFFNTHSRLHSLRGLLVSAPQGIDLDSPQLAFTNMAARGAAFFWDRPDHLARLHHREAGLGGMGEVEGKQLCRKVATKSFPRKSPPMGPVAKNSAPL